MTWIVQPLNFTIDLNELAEYYNGLVKNFDHLKWSFEKCKNDITEEWYDRIVSNPGAEKGYGWAIQSNLEEDNVPCPPYNISTKARLNEYRNTALAHGIISRLQEKIPYAYRWALVVQNPGGTVPLHTDQDDEYTVHIPLQWDADAVFEFTLNNNVESVTMPPTGESYILDTTVPHATFNRSTRDRIGVIFRLNQKYINELMSLKGLV